ncbi:YkvA family protein [Parabacteroides sp. PF5-9]|uniref:YkvA family protein n=1 Tax=Parabacteroides sp. PF5-9 TaxID=1742404 RepID=UPI0024747F1A|nr:YkvA family protein [Parabacteroides sp. PF5-9]MDH6358575.1 uncharacterized membrane protein YkvA (DUF1232 family) [Parabacteroides sp. PF5-9]
MTKRIEDVSFEEINEIEKYGKHYSKKNFWDKIFRIARKVGATVLRPALILYYLLEDDKVPFKHKAYIVGALGYFILPVDLIPESILPVIGFTDDIAVMALALKLVNDSVTPEIKAKADHKVTEILQTNKV